MTRRPFWILTLAAMLIGGVSGIAQQVPAGSYQDLLTLFTEWSAFERPPLLDGAPDYTAATMASRHVSLKTFQTRLEAIKPDTWPVDQQVDHALVRAQMNGFDFYYH